jgi:tRNA U34 5-carboxymethylaminomethyl modifying enzyme MnmG/GidA
MKRFPAGRLNDAPSLGLSASLAAAGFKLGRLQTGTPARLDGKTINFSGMTKQEGDENPLPFSYLNREVDNAVRHYFLVENIILVHPTSFAGQPGCVLSDGYHPCYTSNCQR